MRIGSLFSGAGSWDLAAENLFPAANLAWVCEVDPAASKALAHHWPNVPNLGDVTQIDWSAVEPVDAIAGGFPCTDLSLAGRRAGLGEGTRSGLWSHMATAIDVLRPRYVLIENVRGLLSAEAHRAVESDQDAVGDGGIRPVLRALGAVLGDLADLGFDAEWTMLRASDLGFCHHRARVFILAYPANTASSGRESLDDRPWGPAACGGGERVSRRGARLGTASDADRDAVRKQPEREPWRESAAVTGVLGEDLADSHNKRPQRQESTRRYDVPAGCGAGLVAPTPKHSDGERGNCPSERARRSPALVSIEQYLLTPAQWGDYGPAIRRQESLTRPAPPPTEPNTKGAQRLSAAFAEWMMGWPPGWVTDPVLGISRADQLKIIGNGVVPQQAVAAFTHLQAAASWPNPASVSAVA